MANRRNLLELDFDRIAVTEALTVRLAEAEREYTTTSSDRDAHQLARERMVVLLGELSAASRRWSVVRIPTDPKPDPTLDDRLRRLTTAKLQSQQEIERAKRLLAQINGDR